MTWVKLVNLSGFDSICKIEKLEPNGLNFLLAQIFYKLCEGLKDYSAYCFAKNLK